MSAILNSLNAHNLLIFQLILLILVSNFMVYRALSDKSYVLLMLLSPLNEQRESGLRLDDGNDLNLSLVSWCLMFAFGWTPLDQLV